MVDDEAKLLMVAGFKDRLPHLKTVIYTHAPATSGATSIGKLEGCFSWKSLCSMETDGVDLEYSDRLSKMAANECCAIFYTSGTTGNAKGATIILFSLPKAVMSP